MATEKPCFQATHNTTTSVPGEIAKCGEFRAYIEAASERSPAFFRSMPAKIRVRV
jgi:hypothetical protein